MFLKLLFGIFLYITIVEGGIKHRYRRQLDTDDDGDLCECVPYFQCDEENRIITTGTGLIDPRQPLCTESIDVCCKIPDTGMKPVEPPVEPPYTGEPDPPIVKPPPVIHPPTDDKQPGLPVIPRGLSGCGIKREKHYVNKRYTEDEEGDGTNTRITGVGRVPEATYFGEYPWMVALFKDSKNGPVFSCGGALIKPNVVLTAAHCLNQQTSNNILVRVGDWDASGDVEPLPFQERRAKEILLHNDYDSSNLANDIALILVEDDFELNEAVDTICLPEVDHQDIDYKSCEASGWGVNAFESGGKYQTQLRKVNVPYVERDECQSRLRTTRLGKYFRLHPSFICAGGEPQKDTCVGDGGGPLVCRLNNDPDRWVQIGIVSWGIGCGSDIPGVYTSVQHFYEWIIKNLPSY